MYLSKIRDDLKSYCDNKRGIIILVLQLPITCNRNKSGLGSNEADFPDIELDSNAEKKQAVWRKTQKRYNEIADSSVDV